MPRPKPSSRPARECADLHADLLALRAATRAMPTPPRPRDYTLTPADAARLRGTVLAPVGRRFGSSRRRLQPAAGRRADDARSCRAPGHFGAERPQGGLGSSAAGQAARQPVAQCRPGRATDIGEPNPGPAIAPAAGEGALAASGAPDRAVASAAPRYGVTNAAPVPPRPADRSRRGGQGRRRRRPRRRRTPARQAI